MVNLVKLISVSNYYSIEDSFLGVIRDKIWWGKSFGTRRIAYECITVINSNLNIGLKRRSRK